MKNIIYAIAGIIVGLVIGYISHTGSTASVTGISGAGVTNSTSKQYMVTMAPSTAAATTSSLLNTDATDRGITSSVLFCTGVGTSLTYLTGTALTAWTLQMSTSTSAQDAKINTNYASNLTIATSSPWSEQASSTLGVGGAVSLVWPANTYLNMTFNATNTAACSVGVNTVSL